MLVDLQADPLKTQISFDLFLLFVVHFRVKVSESCSSWCKYLGFVAVGTVIGEVSFALAVVAGGVSNVLVISAASGTVYFHSVGVSLGWGRELSVDRCIIPVLGGRVSWCLLPVVIPLGVVLLGGSFLCSIHDSPLSVEFCCVINPVL